MNNVFDYYYKNISGENFSKDFIISITPDIIEKYHVLEPDLTTNNLSSGVVILPDFCSDIYMLLNKESISVNLIFYELTHVHDILLYKKYFSFKTNIEIKNSKYFELISFWSEYHAEYVELLYSKIFYYTEIEKSSNYEYNLKEYMDELYYDGIIKLDINNNSSYHKFMWMFALIDLCNKYGNRKYEIPMEMKNNIPIHFLYFWDLISYQLNFENIANIFFQN